MIHKNKFMLAVAMLLSILMLCSCSETDADVADIDQKSVV